MKRQQAEALTRKAVGFIKRTATAGIGPGDDDKERTEQTIDEFISDLESIRGVASVELDDKKYDGAYESWARIIIELKVKETAEVQLGRNRGYTRKPVKFEAEVRKVGQEIKKVVKALGVNNAKATPPKRKKSTDGIPYYESESIEFEGSFIRWR